MLDPDNRSLYTAALAPPPGMVFDEAIGATFSADPAILLSVPVHLALFGGGRENSPGNEIAVLESVRRLSDHITLYAQRGRLQVPTQSNVLYGLLESMIVEVNAPGGGVFHPKFWLMRFTGIGDDPSVLLRLMVLSRNLTADRSWDVGLTLEGRPSKRNRKGNQTLSELISKLPGMASGKVGDTEKKRGARFGKELRSVKWELPTGFDEVEFHVAGIGPKTQSSEESKRLAVISPFCRDEALEMLIGTTKQPTALISRPDTLVELSTKTTEKFDRCLVLDDAAETEDGEGLEDDQSHDTCGLHAKVYIFERGWNTHIMLGSANATNAALLGGRNIELLAELTGKSSQVGNIDTLLDAENFGGVLTDYEAPKEDKKPDLELRKAEEELETARNQIASSTWGIECARDAESGKWKLDLVADQDFSMPQGISLARVWLITTLPDGHAVDLSELSGAERLNLGSFAAASITGLLAVELRTEAHNLRVRFVLNLPVIGLPNEERDAAILQTVVRNREGFLRYLLLLLGDLGYGLMPESGDNGGDGVWTFGGAGGMPLLEELVRAYSREPQRLREVRRIVRHLAEDQSADKIVPTEFLDTWAVFEEAMERRND